MNTGKSKSNLTKDISCKCKCKFDGRECNSDRRWNNDKWQCECQKHHICEKDYIWNPPTCSCKNGKYLASIIDNLVIIFNEITDAETKTNQTNFNEENITWNTQNFYILLAFLLITTALLIVVSTYCYLIKYQTKQEHLLLFHVTNDKVINVL